MEKLVLLLDVDEVICFSGYLQLANSFLNTSYTFDDISDYFICEAVVPEEKRDDFNTYISNHNLYENPIFIPDALETLPKLKDYYDIYLCTDCRNPFDLKHSGKIFKDKYDMLFKYIPQDVIPAKNYVLTGTKSIFKADVQVDDLISNFDPDIPLKILFPSFHNKKITETDLRNKNIVKAGNDYHTGWKELEKILIEHAIKNEKEK